MAARYVYHAGSNTAPYDTWAKAATTLTTAITGSVAGDDFWVASDHAESTASAVTLTFPGTSASPDRCISVNRAGSTPPVAADILAGASISTTGASALAINGSAYVQGITFNCASGATGANFTVGNLIGNFLKFEGCAINIVSTATTNRVMPCNSGGAYADYADCTFSFGHASQALAGTNGPWAWRNKPGSTAVTGATLPTTLLQPANGTNRFKVLWSGLDLSSFGSGKTLVGDMSSLVKIVNCKLGASVTVATTPFYAHAMGVHVIGSSTTTNVSRNEIYAGNGTLTTETTIKRTAGASDGVTAYSWKVVTTANAKRTFPFETFEGALWNDTTAASKTLTVHTVTDNVTLTDAEIWLEVEYLASSATPVSTLITDANATVLTTAANQATSTEAWTTTGLVTPVKQQVAVTFTPNMAGPIRWRVKVAKASATVYICPNADLS